MDQLRVLIVDDQLLFADVLAARLSGEGGLVVLPCAHTGAQALALAHRHRPHIVLLDRLLGEENGLTVLRRLRQHHPDVRAIMLSGQLDVDDVVAAFRFGARAWVPKAADSGRLVEVIHVVAAGNAWLPDGLLGPVLDRLLHCADDQPEALCALTARERQVLQYMIDGLNRAEIARALFLSANTVRTHSQNLLAKLGCHSALEAVALARRNGMQPTRPVRE